MRAALAMPSELLREMGQRGRIYIRENFQWSRVVKEFESHYFRILSDQS